MTVKELTEFLNTFPEAHLVDNIEISIMVPGYVSEDDRYVTAPLNEVWVGEDCKTNKITLVFEGIKV